MMNVAHTHLHPVRPHAFSISLKTVFITLLVLLSITVFWQAASVFLLIFAGMLFALFLHEAADWLRIVLPISQRWAITIVLLVLLVGIGCLIWFFAQDAVRQFNSLMAELPRALEAFRDHMRTFALGREIIKEAPAPEVMLNNTGDLAAGLFGVFSTTAGALSGLGLVLIVGLYFAYNPDPYETGIVMIIPPRYRARAREVLSVLAYTLRRWVVGRMVDMLLTAVSLWLALWLLGIPLSLILGLLGGLLSFIPNLGPILSAAPAVLIALVQGPMKALQVAAVYFAINTIEGVLLMPFIERRAVFMPPVLVIGSQLVMGALFGFLGVALATPIVACILVLVKMLYVEDTLGEDIEIQGEEDIPATPEL